MVNNSSVELNQQGTIGGLSLAGINLHDGESRIVEKDGWLFLPATSEEYEDNIVAGHALVGYNGIADATALTLPSDYNGKSYRISAYAFSGLDGITSVTLSDGVMSVENYAFSDCLSLESVAFGASLKKIGYYAFNNCALTSLTFPSTLESIGDYAFYNNRELSGTTTMPAAVTDIGKNAFNLHSNAHIGGFGVIFEEPNGWNEYESDDILHGSPVTFGEDAVANFRKLNNEKHFRKASN